MTLYEAPRVRHPRPEAAPAPARTPEQPRRPADSNKYVWLRRHAGTIALVVSVFSIGEQSHNPLHRLAAPGCKLISSRANYPIKDIRNDLYDMGVDDPGKVTLHMPESSKSFGATSYDVTGDRNDKVVPRGSILTFTDVPTDKCEQLGNDFGSGESTGYFDDPAAIITG